jgi:ATP-dependent RNA helicase RhlE
LLRAVSEQGYTVPTPIQVQAIPVVLAGRDLLGAAQTGTGKTAGFALPILQRISGTATASHSPARHPVRVLIVTPTRELAAQVEESVRTYGKHVKVKSTCIYGGVGIQPQIDALRRGVDIVVATPGRLLDHVQQKTVDLRQVEILVLDEADRMLDMGFIPDIRRILALLPTQRQNLLFSATFPDEIRKLASSFMKNPVTVEVARRNTPAELVGQVAHPVAADRKRELLAHLVKTNDWRQVLVFCKTKHGANRLAQQLEKSGIEADAIHGNKSQGARTRTLKRFKDNELRVLVATDIAARGLDIEALPHVVNYDLPHVAEDYVHRIGRTGRAGIEGEAVSLVSHEERPLMAAIERLINRPVEQRVIEGFEPGNGSSRAAQEPRRHEQRRHEPRRPEQRRPEARRPQSRTPSRPAQPQTWRGRRHEPVPLPAPIAAEHDAQVREARARMAAEGESRPAAPGKRTRRREPQLGGALLGVKRS